MTENDATSKSRTMHESEDQEPEKVESLTLCRCGGCDSFFAVEEFDAKVNCPSCGSKVIAATTNDYDLIKR